MNLSSCLMLYFCGLPFSLTSLSPNGIQRVVRRHEWNNLPCGIAQLQCCGSRVHTPRIHMLLALAFALTILFNSVIIVPGLGPQQLDSLGLGPGASWLKALASLEASRCRFLLYNHKLSAEPSVSCRDLLSSSNDLVKALVCLADTKEVPPLIEAGCLRS